MQGLNGDESLLGRRVLNQSSAFRIAVEILKDLDVDHVASKLHVVLELLPRRRVRQVTDIDRALVATAVVAVTRFLELLLLLLLLLLLPADVHVGRRRGGRRGIVRGGIVLRGRTRSVNCRAVDNRECIDSGRFT